VPDVIAGVPVLLAVPARADEDAAPPVVLWFHGFRADALANAGELLRLADAGVLAVGVDAVGHGRRLDHTLSAKLAASHAGAYPVMLESAEATAAEIPALLHALAARGTGDPFRTGMVGVSMGAFVVYRALRRVPMRAVVAILGSPEWPGADSPHAAPAASFGETALLSITAERDESVPPGAARTFHRRLAAESPDPWRHRYLELAGSPHLVDPDGWEFVMRSTVDWLRTHLR
jgi:dienelactone hydrolase